LGDFLLGASVKQEPSCAVFCARKLLEKMKDVCEEEDADQVVSKINVT
jgi:hypothetical protein